MSKKKEVEIDPNTVRIYGFQSGIHEARIVTQDGIEVMAIHIDSEADAKNMPRLPKFADAIMVAVGDNPYHYEYVESPGDCDQLIDACKKSEEHKESIKSIEAEMDTEVKAGESTKENSQDNLIPFPVVAEGEPVEPVKEKTYILNREDAESKIVQLFIDGEYKNTIFNALKYCDRFRIMEKSGEVFKDGDGCTEFIVLSDFNAPDRKYIEYTAVKTGEKPAAPVESSKPKTEEIIEIEIDVSEHETLLRNAAIALQSLEMSMDDFEDDHKREKKDREREIDAQKSKMYDLARGKSKTHVDCRIQNDWEGQKRYWLRKDNGEVVKTENIPYEEQQLNMNQDLDTGNL